MDIFLLTAAKVAVVIGTRVGLGCILLGGALCDFEFGSRNSYIDGIARAAPFLAHSAMAKCSNGRFNYFGM